MMQRLALAALVTVLVFSPAASAHSGILPRADDLLPPGFTQTAQPAPRVEQGVELPSSGGNGDYVLRFVCPGIQVGGVPPEVRNATGNSGANCPERIIDPQDIMGSPILLVDPRDPGYMAFNAMHGGRGVHQLGNEPPTNQSRDNYLHQPHTTFYSPDGKQQHWVDNPYYSPLQQPPNRQNPEEPLTMFPTAQVLGKQVFGEDNAATVDAQGRVYLASLYSWRNSTNEGEFQYAIGLWKANRLNQPVDYYSGVKVLKLPQNAKADSIHAVYVDGSDRVAVLWRETTDTDPPVSFINYTWTVPGQGAIWTPSKENQRIRGCSGISNPLDYRGLIYIGCFADKNYRQANVTTGRLQMHAIDVRNNAWTASYVDETTIDRSPRSANAVLFDRTDGRMGIASAGVGTNGAPFLNIAYGELGSRWDPADKLASQLNQLITMRPPRPAYEVMDAQVNAAVFVLRSGNVHIIYQERYRASDDQAPPPPNSNFAEFYKGLISVHAGADRVINKLVHLGERNRDANDANVQDTATLCQQYEARYKGATEDVFMDKHDSLVIWQNKYKHQREFILYADQGCVRFAEVFEEQFVIFSFPVPPGTPPIPAPLAAANPSLTGAVAGALAGAMVLRMLAFKRKLAVEAPA